MDKVTRHDFLSDIITGQLLFHVLIISLIGLNIMCFLAAILLPGLTLSVTNYFRAVNILS